MDPSPLHEEAPDGLVVLSAGTQHRTTSIQSLLAKYLLASACDVMLVLEGWDMERQFSLRSEGNRNTETAEALEALFLQGSNPSRWIPASPALEPKTEICSAANGAAPKESGFGTSRGGVPPATYLQKMLQQG
jgi:hypothetical protein